MRRYALLLTKSRAHTLLVALTALVHVRLPTDHYTRLLYLIYLRQGTSKSNLAELSTAGRLSTTTSCRLLGSTYYRTVGAIVDDKDYVLCISVKLACCYDAL